MAISRLHVGKRLSEVAIYNRTVYLAGQIAEDTQQDIAGQTREVLAHIDRLLAEAGSDKTLILSTQIFISSMSHFPAMNEVWVAWVPNGAAPARTTVQAHLASEDLLIEVTISAAVAQA